MTWPSADIRTPEPVSVKVPTPRALTSRPLARITTTEGLMRAKSSPTSWAWAAGTAPRRRIPSNAALTPLRIARSPLPRSLGQPSTVVGLTADARRRRPSEQWAFGPIWQTQACAAAGSYGPLLPGPRHESAHLRLDRLRVCAGRRAAGNVPEGRPTRASSQLGVEGSREAHHGTPRHHVGARRRAADHDGQDCVRYPGRRVQADVGRDRPARSRS